MSAQRLTDAQISAALRAHLPAHARADVRMRIAAEVSTTRQRQPFPSVFALLSDADPDARRRVMLLAAALLLAVGVVAAAVVGALLRKDDPVRITTDPAVDAPAFVDEAFAAHRFLAPMTLVAAMRDAGSEDVQRFYVDGTGRLRHECCGGAIIIIGGTGTGSSNMDESGNPIWLSGSAGQTHALPGFELASYSGFQAPDCAQVWRYIGPDRVVDRPAHHLACPQRPEGAVDVPDLELWLDAELGITLRSTTWAIQLDESNQPVGAVGSTMTVESIVLGEPDPALFEPPAGLPVMTLAEYNCQFDPSSCASGIPTQAPTPGPATTPVPGNEALEAPDVSALVASTLESYARSPEMAVFVEQRGNLNGEWRRFTDGTGRFREEWHFDPASPANPTVYLGTPEGVFESWYQEDGTTEWRQMQSGGPALSPAFLTLGLPGTCAEGWTYGGLDLLLGAEVWHIACARNEYWIDRDRLLVLRYAVEPDALHTTGESTTVLHIEVGPQPDSLFELPDDAIVTEGRG